MPVMQLHIYSLLHASPISIDLVFIYTATYLAIETPFVAYCLYVAYSNRKQRYFIVRRHCLTYSIVILAWMIIWSKFIFVVAVFLCTISQPNANKKQTKEMKNTNKKRQMISYEALLGYYKMNCWVMFQ